MAILSPSQGDNAAQAPASNGFAITPSDSTVFSNPTRGIYVGGAGNLVVRFADATSGSITLGDVKPGTILPIRVSMVMASTTATSLVGLY